jgi:hypothetical protein
VEDFNCLNLSNCHITSLGNTRRMDLDGMFAWVQRYSAQRKIGMAIAEIGSIVQLCADRRHLRCLLAIEIEDEWI